MQDRLGFRRAFRARLAGFHRRCRILAAASSLVCLSSPAASIPTFADKQPPTPIEQPALWVLSDADTTIYLFGTFHALDERIDWLARPIRAAFDSSDELVLETVVPADPAELLGILAKHDLIPAPVIGAPVIASTDESIAVAGSTMAVGRSAGLTPERGADAVLRRIADAQGKPVDGLESFDFQLGMVKGLPTTTGAPAPTAAPHPEVRQVLLAMRSAWKRGDGSDIAAVLNHLEAQSPATYQRLFVDRNKHWASWIADRMTRPGTVFVAVGTGHLIGRDSLQQKLARHGYRTMRIK
ncbi:MAG: TraB/GumN family protein [Pseudomonadota bacterium]